MSVNTIVVLLHSLFVKLVQNRFSSGIILPGVFEYSDINGWMKPSEAAQFCENNLQCGGFTFHGILSTQLPYEIYFFHYVSDIFMDKEGFAGWDWTSYTVNRYTASLQTIAA